VEDVAINADDADSSTRFHEQICRAIESNSLPTTGEFQHSLSAFGSRATRFGPSNGCFTSIDHRWYSTTISPPSARHRWVVTDSTVHTAVGWSDADWLRAAVSNAARGAIRALLLFGFVLGLNALAGWRGAALPNSRAVRLALVGAVIVVAVSYVCRDRLFDRSADLMTRAP
jgi:hypothetical protein